MNLLIQSLIVVATVVVAVAVAAIEFIVVVVVVVAIVIDSSFSSGRTLFLPPRGFDVAGMVYWHF